MKRRRAGFSLMEVILAIAIMATASVLLGELTRFGMWNARSARDLTAAQLMCDSKLNEVVAGIEPLANVQEATFDDTIDPDQEWKYSIEYGDINVDTGLVTVTVTVKQNLEAKLKPVQFAMTRWMIPISTESTTEEGTSSSSSSSNSSSGSSGSSSSGGSQSSGQ